MLRYIRRGRVGARGLRVFAFLVSPILSVFEFFLFFRASRREPKYSPVFIIGAPRTGSTIIYQAITNYFDVVYINNLSAVFYRNLAFGVWLGSKIFRNKPHGNFFADHGDTSKYGFNAPSECGEFWYRWIPKGQHYLDDSSVTDEMVASIRREFTSIINYFDKPLIINNNNIALRLGLIKRAFPDARFIVLDRDPLFVAQSLLRARNKFYGDYTTWWSMKPGNYVELASMTPAKQVVMQHFYINKSMKEGLSAARAASRVLDINYKSLGEFISPGMISVSGFLSYGVLRGFGSLPDLNMNETFVLGQELRAEIITAIDEVGWNDCQG